MRTKSQPKWNPRTVTIVGAAAHAVDLPTAYDALGVFENGEDLCSPTHAVSQIGTSHPTKRKRIITPDKAGTDNDEDDVIFDQSTRVVPRRVRFDDKEDEEEEDATRENNSSWRKRRRIINDDGDGEAKQENDGSIIEGERDTIHLPSGAFKIIATTSTTTGTNTHELICFHLSNISLDVLTSHTIVLGTDEAVVETILKRCNKSMESDDDILDIDHIIRAHADGMLEIILKAAPWGSKVDVSIRLLLDSCLDQLSESNRVPPIPVPRKKAWYSKQQFTQYYPSYTLAQALGGIFKRSIFDDVAETLLNKQYSLEQKDSLITAKMVYRVVDNAHAEECKVGDESSLMDIPGLLPTLRPYQNAAVSWMLQRESALTDEANEWELCWFVIVESPNAGADRETNNTFTRSNILSLPEWKTLKSSPDERRIFFNPFAGCIATSYDEAKGMMMDNEDNSHVMGGILGESMGLGKTVEVLACILSNPKPPETPAKVKSALSTTSHSTIHHLPINNKTTCICGRSHLYNGCLSWVVCGNCGEEMHGRCAGFETEAELVSHTIHFDSSCVRICSMEYCTTCAVAQPILESRATLIVTPPAIVSQWHKEISRHTKLPETERPLKVIVYQGIRNLCQRGTSSPHEDFHFVHPRRLADADIVLVTYNTLMTDLGHTDENPYAGSTKERLSLRSKKRYGVLPSPLTCIKWWRVCLDEAQRVEAPTATSARMAHKLITDKRWCVTGTPLGKGRLEDLYGLLLFLKLKPFDNKSWFNSSFILSQGDALQRMSHLLSDIMWRSTKDNILVCQQMGIPEQEEKKIRLNFTAVEKYFYQQQYEATSLTVGRWTQSRGASVLNNSLQRLRAACCHPQVGARGIRGYTKGPSKVLSMDQILEKLVDDAREKCSESQRIAILHTIGLASLTNLKASEKEEDDDARTNMEKSEKIYQEALYLADSNASPSELIGSATLSGSVGFLSNQQTMNNGVTRLEWQMNPSEGKICQALATMNFIELSPQISSMRVQSCQVLPSQLQEEQAIILRPQKITLQMSNTATGGGFVNVHSFSLTDSTGWTEVSGFRAKKAKAWRLVITSYHNDSVKTASRCYTGLNIQLFEPEIADDTLQRLHILHNASNLLTTLTQCDSGDTNDDEKKTKLKAMESEEQILYNQYMAHAHTVHNQRKFQFKSAVIAREEYGMQLKNDSSSTWYEDVLAWYTLHDDDQGRQQLCETVRDDLFSYYENMNARSGVSELDNVLVRRGRFSNFNSADGLHIALGMRIQQGEDQVNLRKANQENWLKTVLRLSSSPKDSEVYSNSTCRRCRNDWEQTGPVCAHCHLEDDLVKVEKLSNDPEISCVLKAIEKVVKNRLAKADSRSKQFLKGILQNSTIFFDLQSKLREEISAAKSLWKAHFDLLSDIDELNQCKRSMRLRQEGENVYLLSRNEAAFIVDASAIDMEMNMHEAKQASALAELRRNKGRLTYLKSQRVDAVDQSGSKETDSSKNTCSICLAPYGTDRSVLPCGHAYHPDCVDRLFSRSARTMSIHCPMRCPRAVRREDVLLASCEKKPEAKEVSREIIGDWGTKVNTLVADVMEVVQLGEKGIVFSQWEDMISIVAEALSVNKIIFIRPRAGKKFGEDIKRFRSGNCPLLVLNVKNSAEGLTLTEANHCFMLEPMLNCGLDAQAINRIHRIGQMKKTTVHRYIMINTIEEKIDKIRMERAENHFEDDLEEQQKHSITGGGIDGGFDESELRQLFG